MNLKKRQRFLSQSFFSFKLNVVYDLTLIYICLLECPSPPSFAFIVKMMAALMDLNTMEQESFF